MSREKGKTYSQVGMASEDEDAASSWAATSNENSIERPKGNGNLNDGEADVEDEGQETDASGDEGFSRRPRLTRARAVRKCVCFFLVSLVMGACAAYMYAYLATQSGIGMQRAGASRSISP